jgi:GTP cyclohydrolase I
MSDDYVFYDFQMQTEGESVEEEPLDLLHTRFLSVEALAEYLLLDAAGMDLNSEHARRTPSRFVAMLREMTTPEPFEFRTFPTKTRDMVVVKKIPVKSLCAHHVVPFIGFAHVGYIPKELIVGLSKIPRLVQNCARALCVQEELTATIADELEKGLETDDVAVVMECEHLCMTIRGVQSPGTTTYTAVMRGVFSLHERTAKAEFFQAIGQ